MKSSRNENRTVVNLMLRLAEEFGQVLLSLDID